jgi:hypothetical protein
MLFVHASFRLLAVLPHRMRLTVIQSVFKDIIQQVPFLSEHSDDAPFLIEVLSRCSKTRFSPAPLSRSEPGTHSQACLYAAGTFDSDLYVVSRCAKCIPVRTSVAGGAVAGFATTGTHTWHLHYMLNKHRVM